MTELELALAALDTLEADMLVRFNAVRGHIRNAIDVDNPPAPFLSYILITPSTFGVTEAGTVQLTATAYDQYDLEIVGTTFTWVSSNTSVATVNSSGLVTGVAAGTCSIRASATGGVQSTPANCTVSPATVATVTVSPTSLVATVGDSTATLTATVRDASSNVLTGRTVTWASDATGVATVTTPGQSTTVTYVAAGAANVTATCETVHSSAGGVTVNSASGGAWTHEPAGMTLVTDHPFTSAILGTNWTGETGYDTSWTISTDAAAPRSPSNVARLNFPNGKAGGQGFPNVTPPDFRTRNHARLFVAFAFKLGSNFVGGGSGVQKLLHIWGSTTGTSYGNLIIPGVFWSASANKWLWNAGYQGFPSTNNAGISVNNLFGTVTLDTWYEVEIDLTFNTGAAVEDGAYSMYIKNPATGATQQKLLTGLHMSNASSRKWYYLDIDPTYMSTGFSAPNAMQLYLDDFYLSTKA